jgi:hypothetical protein
MRTRLGLLLLLLALVAVGCGSNSGGGSSTQGIRSNPESGTQAQGGFPGAGVTTGPDVVTTKGKSAATDTTGKAGGGSSATCIGC